MSLFRIAVKDRRRELIALGWLPIGMEWNLYVHRFTSLAKALPGLSRDTTLSEQCEQPL